MGIPRIETERLLLRGWTPPDMDAYAAMNADPDVRRFMYPARLLTKPESDADVGALVDQWDRIGFGHWVVELKETGRMIGRTGAKRHPDWHLDAENSEVGWLYAREAWGKGYATEGARAAVRFLFEEIGRPEVISIADPGNTPSHRVMERAGLSYAGRRTWEERGIDCVWYSAHQ